MSRLMSYFPQAKVIPGTVLADQENQQAHVDHVAEEDEFGGVSYNDDGQDAGEYYGEDTLEDEIQYYYFEPGYLGRLKMAIRNLSIPCLIASLKWLTDSAILSCSISFDDLLLAMAFFAIFAEDIMMMNGTNAPDNGFAIVMTVFFFFFVFELCANTLTKTQYVNFFPRFEKKGFFGSFNWAADVLFVISFIPDIPFAAKILHITGNETLHTVCKYGKTIRLIRLIRLAQSIKGAVERHKKRIEEERLLAMMEHGLIEEEDLVGKQRLNITRESRIGQQLSNSTYYRVILIVCAGFYVLPVFTVRQYGEADQGAYYAAQMLQAFNTNSSLSQDVKSAALSDFLTQIADVYGPKYILYLEVSPMVNGAIIDRSFLRSTLRGDAIIENYFSYYDPSSSTTYETLAIFNATEVNRQWAFYFIALQAFVAILFVGAYLLITNDAQRLVLAPIERMMNMVDEVAKNPLQKLQFEHPTGTPGSGEYETRLLESTVEKITGLLRVGFGEAGAGIIRANLSYSDADGGSAINPLLPGVRVYAIVGFCDIHQFDFVNKQLERDVMVFANAIAEIVHSSVHSWSGQCNKNLGNAFVVIWRIGDEESLLANQHGARVGKDNSASLGIEMVSQTTSNNAPMYKPGGGSGPPLPQHMMSVRSAAAAGNALMGSANAETDVKKKEKLIDLRRVPGVDILADHALISYCKIIAEINRNKGVLAYRREPRLTQNGTQEFKVRMGFGLHAGWAIEGAVGSLQKVDATYLSPHVNMAARLETSSRQYGVPLLASQNFYDLLSREAQDLCRRLDVVTVKGSEVPIGIYTYDAYQDQEFYVAETRPKVFKRRMSGGSTSSLSSVPENVKSDKNLPALVNKPSSRKNSLVPPPAGAGAELNKTTGSSEQLASLDGGSAVVSAVGSIAGSILAATHTEGIIGSALNAAKHVVNMVSPAGSRRSSTADATGGGGHENKPSLLTSMMGGGGDGGGTGAAADPEGPSKGPSNSVIAQAAAQLASADDNASVLSDGDDGSVVAGDPQLQRYESESSAGDYAPSTPVDMNGAAVKTPIRKRSGAPLAPLPSGTPPRRGSVISAGSSSGRKNSGLDRPRRMSGLTVGARKHSLVTGGPAGQRRMSPPPNIPGGGGVGGGIAGITNMLRGNRKQSVPIAGGADRRISVKRGASFLLGNKRDHQQGSARNDGKESLGPFLTAANETSDVFDRDIDMKMLRKHVSGEFRDVFSVGINAYLTGDWSTARDLLEDADAIMEECCPGLGGDGPSQTLLRYMDEYNYEAPSSWKGYRPLTSK